jgi:hypothetical protein
MEFIFHAGSGPFRVETRGSLDPSAPWVDVTNVSVTALQPGVFRGLCSEGPENLGFYRVVSESDGIAELNGWTVLARVSAPANGSYFVAGESPVVTVTILDTLDQPLSRDDFATLNLYLDGPQDPKQTVTAAKLLNASTNRAVRPHHYIDLKTNPNVGISGRVLTYPLQAVSNESTGTYTVSVWSVLASDPLQQIMKFATVQIGTNTVEQPVVAKTQCAACHEGPVSGKMYLHHIDPSGSSKGNWSLDFEPVKTCKSCHNNDGYAAFSDTNAPAGKVSDAIVRRAHGVHMGQDLKLAFNTNSVNGNFKDYTHVEFPADVRNCTKCHVDNRWKTQPSRTACGSCHDNVWFGADTAVPTGMVGHPGGEQTDDTLCSICHAPDTSGFSTPVAVAHQVAPPAFKQAVKLSMSPPANGKFYVTGEAPQLSIQITNLAAGVVINPTNIVEPLVSTNVQPNEWRRANLYVSGPRSATVPVLTTAALNPDPNQYYAENDFRVRRDPTREDPRVTRTADAIIYQLSPITNLATGTYTAFVEVTPNAPLGGWAYLNFQVGSTNAEPRVAGNCTDCHGDTRMHGSYFAVTFTPDICKSCHDYQHQMTGKTNWASANMGFGAAPLSRRVHGVHFGNYLNKPQEINPSADYSHLIFPQDVRNCTKCHAETSTWNEKPSRLACLACHDSDADITHATLMPCDPTPQDPWNGDEVETCTVCHDADGAFSPKVVHSISNPYVPPYPRALRGE